MRSTEYDCCNCAHYGVCYKIRMYNIGQENAGLYCPSFHEKQSEILRGIFDEIECALDACYNPDICADYPSPYYNLWLADRIAELKKKYTEADDDQYNT